MSKVKGDFIEREMGTDMGEGSTGTAEKALWPFPLPISINVNVDSRLHFS